MCLVSDGKNNGIKFKVGYEKIINGCILTLDDHKIIN